MLGLIRQYLEGNWGRLCPHEEHPERIVGMQLARTKGKRPEHGRIVQLFFRVGDPRPLVVARFHRTADADERLRREFELISELSVAAPGLTAVPVALVSLGGRNVLLERPVLGSALSTLLAREMARGGEVEAEARRMVEEHFSLAETALRRIWQLETVDTWGSMSKPVALEALLDNYQRTIGSPRVEMALLEKTLAPLRAGDLGPVALAHGDFIPGNFCVDPEMNISLLDWEFACADESRTIDALRFLHYYFYVLVDYRQVYGSAAVRSFDDYVDQVVEGRGWFGALARSWLGRLCPHTQKTDETHRAWLSYHLLLDLNLQQRARSLIPHQELAATRQKILACADQASLRELHSYPVEGDTAGKLQIKPKRYVCSIVMPVYNKVDFTRRCIEALASHTPENMYELVIVDNASTDGTKELLGRLDGDVRVITNESNVGFVEACNQGAEAASGMYLIFLNNDTQPQKGWLESMVALAESDISVGAVGAKLVYPDGSLQEAGGIIFSDGSGWNYGRGSSPADPRFNFVREVDYCSGAALLVRSDLWKSVGGFDRMYAPAYYEDTDLCFAIRQAGYRVMYQPEAAVIHHEGTTAGTDLSSGAKKYQEINRAKFVEKWSEALARQHSPDPAIVRKASDRAAGKRILVIDPLMPMYDRASGSRRLYEMLKILAASGNAVTFIARNGMNQGRYVVELQRMGIEVYPTDPDKMRQLGHAVNAVSIGLPRLLQDSQYDLALLSFWYIAEHYLEDIRRFLPQTRVYVDTVDVHFLREERQAELYRDRELRLKAADTKKRELAIYRQADALIAVTEEDRQHLLAEIPKARTYVIPNIHDVSEDVPPWAGRRGLLFVGNFRHPPNVDAVLYFCLEVLPLVRAQVPDVTFTIVGDAPPPHIQDLAGNGVEVAGHVPDTGPYLRSCRVSVAPLRFGAGMKGKIGEALAAGLPVVTTSIGAEGMTLPSDGRTLLVGDDPATFAEAVVRVYQDEALWSELSEAGRAIVDARYSPRVVASRLGEVLLQLAEREHLSEPTSRGPFPPGLAQGSVGRVGPAQVIPGLTSIIILTHNQWEDTERCLASIARHTSEPHELIAVDNGSTDGTVDRLRAYQASHDNVRLVLNSGNRGFAAGNNQGLAVASGEYLLLLNNDTVVSDGWLGRMLSVLEQHPEVGIVGPMSNYVTGPQLVQDTTYRDLDEMQIFSARWAAEHAGQSTRIIRVVGFCLLARRAIVDRIGGLDEQFGTGNFEDDDYCIRAAQAGFEARIAQDVFVHHTGSQTFIGAGINYRRNTLHNWKLFKAKWGIPVHTPIEQGYSMPHHSWDTVRLYVPLPEQPAEDGAASHAGAAMRSEVVLVLSADEETEGLTTCLEHLRRFRPTCDLDVRIVNGVTPVPRSALNATSAAEPTVLSALMAALSANARYVVLLSADVIVGKGWLEGLLAVAASDPSIAAVGPTCNAAPAPQRIRQGYRSLKREFERYSAQRARDFRHRWSEVPYLGGFCLLLSCGAVGEVGGLSSDAGLADVLWDLYRRLRANGYKLAHAEGVYVHHAHLSVAEGADFKVGAEVDSPTHLENRAAS